MYSNSRNDVPRMAKRYGTIAAHTRRRASVLVVFVVSCVHVHSFAGLIRRTPPPTFSDTAIPTATLIPLFSSSELTGCGYPGLLDRKNRSDMCPRWESNPRLPACKASTISTRPGPPPHYFISVLFYLFNFFFFHFLFYFFISEDTFIYFYFISFLSIYLFNFYFFNYLFLFIYLFILFWKFCNLLLS